MSMMPPPPPPPPGSFPPGYQPYQSVNAPMNYASWGARVGGYIVNGLSAALFILPALVAFFAGPREYTECTVNDEPGLCKLPTSSGWAIIAAVGAIGLIAFIVMYCKAVGSKGQFWGHRAAGVKIVDADTGGPIGAGKAFLRQLLSFINTAPCYLGYLWPLWDERHQTFTDKIFNTVSIRA